MVEDPENLRALIRDFASIKGLKIFVHGEGTMASMVAEKMGIHIRQTSDGRDVIDDRVMDLVTMVYGGLVNKRLVAIMQWRGLNALGLTGVDLNLVQSTKVPIKPVNVGRVGTVRRVNSSMLINLLEQGVVPVIAPIGVGEDGESYNINADYVAAEMAGALKAEKLLLLTDVEGIYKDFNDKSSFISTLHMEEARAYIKEGIIAGGMIPKVEACLTALEQGAGKTHIIDGRLAHSIILEIFTSRGIGTQVVR